LVLLALLVKLAVVGVTLAESGWRPDPLTAVSTAWAQWDARHYIALATQGYQAGGDARNLIAFLPLYPGLTHLLSMAGLPPALGVLLISNVAGVVAAILLYEIARGEGDESSAFRAAALFTIFPTAYFLLVGYTEALFCALTFGAVLLSRRRRWLSAGVLGGLAAATRLTGLALIPFLAVELVTGRAPLRHLWRALASPLLVAAGFCAYLGINLAVTGNALTFVTVQRQHWSHSLAAPWVGFAEAIRGISWRAPWEKLTVGAGEMAGGIAAFATATLSWLRLRPSDAAYATAATVMVTFLPFWLSIPRYLLSIYPLFLLAGRLRNTWLYRGLLAASFLSLLGLASAFIAGYWAF
jgi:hypothetical protein